MESNLNQNLYESVAALQKTLLEAELESMVIGGLAVMAWGEPRLTRDADLKILIRREEASKLLAALPAGFQLHSENPLETLQQYGFLFTHDLSGVRIDLMLTDMGFDEIAIGRRQEKEMATGVSVSVCSPEDLIIYKLLSTRPRDHEDATGIIKRQIKTLDHNYIEDWLRQFELAVDDSTLIDTYKRMVAGYI